MRQWAFCSFKNADAHFRLCASPIYVSYIILFLFLNVTSHTGTRVTFQLLTVKFASINMQTKLKCFMMDNNQNPQAQSEPLRSGKCLFWGEKCINTCVNASLVLFFSLSVFPQEQPEAVTPTTELEMDNMDTFLERLPPSGKMTKTESLIISSNR